jgi:hypothetical protein
MRQRPERRCANPGCKTWFRPVHRLQAPIEGLRVPDGYAYGPSRRDYCSETCRHAARRIRQREAWARKPACRQCGSKRTALVFGAGGYPLEPSERQEGQQGSFCSLACVLAHFKLSASPDEGEVKRFLGILDDDDSHCYCPECLDLAETGPDCECCECRESAA